MRKMIYAAIVAGLVLSGCSGAGSDGEASPSPSPSASDVAESATPSAKGPEATLLPKLDDVKVAGEFGKVPTVTGPWPFKVDKTQVKVLKKGEGPKVGAESGVSVHYHGLVARTGQVFQSSFAINQPAMLSMGGVIPGFKTGLVGQSVGSRVLLVIPGKEAYDAAGGLPQAGIQVGDTLIFVVDILDVALNAPEGKAIKPAAGLPKVTEKDGKAVIAIGDAKKPTKLVSQTLIEGTGEKIEANDAITVHFTEVAWSTGETVAASYEAGGKTALLNQLIVGWREGLVGKPVGSRVLLVIPPDKAYPEGNDSPKVAPKETLVAVVDILMRQPGMPPPK